MREFASFASFRPDRSRKVHFDPYCFLKITSLSKERETKLPCLRTARRLKLSSNDAPHSVWFASVWLTRRVVEEVCNLGTKEKKSEILTPNRELSAAYRAARKRFALFGRLYYFRHYLFREPTSVDGVTRQETANRIFSRLIIPYVNHARAGILQKVVKRVTIWFTSRFFIYPPLFPPTPRHADGIACNGSIDHRSFRSRLFT